MRYDVAIIGAGLSGLTAASLLSKRGLQVIVLEKGFAPGGSCRAFKRNGALLDLGISVFLGFGAHGCNAHRFLFDCLEEPIDVVRRDPLCAVWENGRSLRLGLSPARFTQELGAAFPAERTNIERFCRDTQRWYRSVGGDASAFTTPDELHPADALRKQMRHPIACLIENRDWNRSAQSLLQRYFTDPALLAVFHQLTALYFFTGLEETPAALLRGFLAEVWLGGGYYPVGSSLQLAGRLEKSIEARGGVMRYETEVARLPIEHGRVRCLITGAGEQIEAEDVIVTGTVWNLYGKLLSPTDISAERARWAREQTPTASAVLLYAVVDRRAIPPDAVPVERLAGDPAHPESGDITVSIPSLDDRTLCAADEHVVIAMSPVSGDWSQSSGEAYRSAKRAQRIRLLTLLEARYPGLDTLVRHVEIATPRTLERYLGKNSGAIAGPRQPIGRRMSLRLHTRTEWRNLFCCGESTVLGTGTPWVTVSGISAANAVLQKHGLPPFSQHGTAPSAVNELASPVRAGDAYADADPAVRELMRLASRCQFCEHPRCTAGSALDVRGMMRRAAVGNIVGARRVPAASAADATLATCENHCVEKIRLGQSAPIRAVSLMLQNFPE